MGDSDFWEALKPYLKANADVRLSSGLAGAPIDLKSPYTRVNAVYFDNRTWASDYIPRLSSR